MVGTLTQVYVPTSPPMHDSAVLRSLPSQSTEDIIEQTEGLQISDPGPQPLPPLPIIIPQVLATRISPAHLSIHEFGSRFIPHSSLPITMLLPILSDRYLLIGNSDGLGMLDVIPENEPLSADANVGYVHALEAAKRRDVWLGEGCVLWTIRSRARLIPPKL